MANGDDGYVAPNSAFGGHPLSEIEGLPEQARAALEGHGYVDAEQVIGAAVLADVRPALEELTGENVDRLVELLRSAIGENASMMAEAIVPGTFALGVLPPNEEIEALIAMAATEMPAMTAAALPPSVNHAQRMPPVKQQGGRGTCVAFSMTAMHEFYRSQSGAGQDFSEQFLYHQTKLIDGSNGCGTWAVKAAQVLANVGQAREAIWAYNPNPPCNDNGVQPGNAMADAANYRLPPVILNPRDVNAMKAALASGCVCEFSIPVYNSWYQNAAARQAGRITMRLPGEINAGGHAMCLIGYQDDSAAPGGGFFILRNSWGLGWGAQCPYGAGNGTIPYAYISSECWEAVTTAVPGRRVDPVRPVPWWLRWLQPFGGEAGGPEEGGGRRTIVIDTGGADIIIR
ncbi:MAG TPA: C1 family peptidase [Allosphingosinicella sp.]|nr:C1 family peptidase [Allosphingosinicella sp.]